MQCPKCLSHNSGGASFCDQCGAPLEAGGRSMFGAGARARGIKLLLAIATLGTLVCMIWILLRDVPDAAGPLADPTSLRRGETRSAASTVVPETISHRTASTSDSPAAPPASARGGALESGAASVAVGIVEVRDRFGGTLARIAAAVTGGNWIAIPRRPCLGGARFIFRPGEPGESEAEDATWQDSEPVLLLRLPEAAEFDSPPLARWDEDMDVAWLSLKGTHLPVVEPGAVDERGSFLYFTQPNTAAGAGVFLANENIVGWTFGDLLPGAWLWNGAAGERIVAEGGVAAFYDATFAGGREESFLEEQARGDEFSPEERLRLLAEGCRRAPKLTAEDTPESLRLPLALNQMKSLSGLLLQQGLHEAVAHVLDESVLRGAGDLGLLLAAVTALRDTQGASAAIAMIEAVGGALVEPTAVDLATLLERERLLYLSWIQEALAGDDWNSAWYAWNQAQGKFAQDAETYLHAVELRLAQGDVPEAERLLDARWHPGHVRGWYPEELENRVARLRAEIAKQKVPAGVIQIRFPPGSTSIPAQALLNGGTLQDFIIDTGATVTTIPAATAQQLGIRITNTTQRRLVRTAAGDVLVPEVTLESVALGAAVVREIKVVVHDLPQQPGLGLLGVNFLRFFRVDLNTEAGILNLEPLGK